MNEKVGFWPVPDAAAWDELADCLASAQLALQALMELAGAAAPQAPVQAQALHALLTGPYGQVQQAHAALQVLQRPVPRCPPAPARAAGTCCWHDAQGLVERT